MWNWLTYSLLESSAQLSAWTCKEWRLNCTISNKAAGRQLVHLFLSWSDYDISSLFWWNLVLTSKWRLLVLVTLLMCGADSFHKDPGVTRGCGNQLVWNSSLYNQNLIICSDPFHIHANPQVNNDSLLYWVPLTRCPYGVVLSRCYLYVLLCYVLLHLPRIELFVEMVLLIIWTHIGCILVSFDLG